MNARSRDVIRHRIAVIPGDGIGKEVVPEGLRVLESAGRRFGIEFHWDHFDWSCETYRQTGRMMPGDGLDMIARHDAIFLGAVGFPGVPDHISLWGLLIPIRRRFQQYINLRPVRLLPGVSSPLAGVRPGDIDFWIVRETTRASIPRSADGSTLAQKTNWSFRRACSPGAGSTASSHTPSIWRRVGRGST